MPHRTMTAFCSVLATLAMLTGALPAPFLALAGDDHDRARAAVQAGRALPLEEIVAKANAAYPGRILDVELEDEDDRLIYEIKTITDDGRVMKLFYDAATGELLKARGHDRKRHGR